MGGVTGGGEALLRAARHTPTPPFLIRKLSSNKTSLLGGHIMSKNTMISSCGLACFLCSSKLDGKCEGCLEHKAEKCGIKSCCASKGIDGCYACGEFPCDRDFFTSTRVCAFVKCARELGIGRMVELLKKNDRAGIKYHKADGSKGDYDLLESEKEIVELVKHGR